MVVFQIKYVVDRSQVRLDHTSIARSGNTRYRLTTMQESGENDLDIEWTETGEVSARLICRIRGLGFYALFLGCT